ncbi:hypothetical protein H6804_00525 [Candidatus Nomurabacteria bacterium]|uniref:Cell division protein FtsX n=1 Tax=candidate division WWE3 bacterium TaxID=2053526 RepID=A0A955E013_UNCKA|nr:permease-like cell division protein FtsX [candidate division WWE3 bacterium]MCB9826747.1 hypothetical protein [Candidatus Nomurabacteria bacterium]MCB9827642.1 hypothetical protein [Candidatus Nomurabacteria bacterium]HXK52702.1 permease-like cell division protein FtsX [bacterium]
MKNSFYKKEKLLIATNIISVTITFLLLGGLAFVIAFTQTGIRKLEEQAQITIFFEDAYPESSILNLANELENDPQVSNVNYVSKEEAYSIFTDLNKDEPVLLESITPDILPASLEIKTKKLADMNDISERLSNMDGVEEIKFYKDVIERFTFWTNVSYAVGIALVSLFLIVSYAIILITLRINIGYIGKELEILKLVGASDAYIKNPLVKQGVSLGLISAFISGALLLSFALIVQFAHLINTNIKFGFIPEIEIALPIFALIINFVLVASGAALGYIGSVSAIQKYINH